MAIEFKARVLLELGAELISSDAVAFYELIKNAIDARSTSVAIAIHIALQFTEYQELCRQLRATKNDDFDGAGFLDKVLAVMEPDVQEEVRQKFLTTLGHPRTVVAALEALEEAYLAGSFIVVADKGHGMDAEILQKGYLTIGTPMRLLSKSRSTEANWNHQSAPGGPILGEKGIGRLAAMRLGHYVHVQTGMEEDNGDPDPRWMILELDWRAIFTDPNLDSSALDYEPETGPKKQSPRDHGTTLTIRCL